MYVLEMVFKKHGRSPCDSNLRLNSVVLVYYNVYLYLLIQMNKSIYGVNSLVSLTENSYPTLSNNHA